MATTLREGVDIVNESLRSLGYEYQIDTTSNDTMTQGLEAIGAYAPSQRNLIMEQMNLILQQRNFGVMFDASKNKFREFLVDMSTEGFGIEDIFHELLEGRLPLWDNQATDEEIYKNLVSADEAKIHKFFHTSRMQRSFEAVIDDRNYEKVFTRYGVTRYIDTKLANLSWSAEKWLMDRAIEVITTMISDGKIVFRGGHNPNTKIGVDNIVEDIKATMAGFLTPNALYNYGVYDEEEQRYRSVINMTDRDSDIFLAVTPEFLARIKVHGYSNAFNLSQYELEGRLLYLPAGTDLGTHNGERVLACAVDRRAILLGIRHWNGTSFFIPNVERVKHWLNIDGMQGYNTVFNAVAFTGESVDDFFGDENAIVFRNDWSSATNFKVNGKNVAFYTDEGSGFHASASVTAPKGSDVTFTLTEMPIGYDIFIDGVNVTLSLTNGTYSFNVNNSVEIIKS